MRLYRGLARVFPRSFSAKLMTVVFIGVHVPLLGLLLWMAVSGHYQRDTMWTVVGVVLGATLVGTAMAMMALYRLMAPLRQAADALEAYYDEQRLPHCPTWAMTRSAGCCAASTATCTASTPACATCAAACCSIRSPRR